MYRRSVLVAHFIERPPLLYLQLAFYQHMPDSAKFQPGNGRFWLPEFNLYLMSKCVFFFKIDCIAVLHSHPSLSPSLRILALEKLGAVFNQVAFPLQYTPRKFVIHPETNNLILIETDHNAYTEATKAQRKQQMAEVSEPGLYMATFTQKSK